MSAWTEAGILGEELEVVNEVKIFSFLNPYHPKFSDPPELHKMCDPIVLNLWKCHPVTESIYSWKCNPIQWYIKLPNS